MMQRKCKARAEASSLLGCYAEPKPFLCKESARREQKHQACLDVMPSRSLSYAKIMQTESRDSSLLVIYADVQLILCKDNAFLLIQQSKWLQINIIW